MATGGHAALGKKLSLREIQLAELEILKLFAIFCEKNGCRYYLSGGTLLGAVRHGGFIPWDDDIDVIMPRPDYRRFLALFAEALGRDASLGSRYRLCVNEFDTIARVMDTRTVVKMPSYASREDIGLWLDVFPMDGMPSGRLTRALHYLRVRFLKDCLYFLSTTPNIRRRNPFVTALQYLAAPFRPVLRLIGVKRIAERINRIAEIYGFAECEFCAAIAAGYGLSEVNVRNEYEPQIRLQFEGTEFTTTAAYRAYLTNLYGDYMQPPPEDKRNKHHVDAWRK